MSDQHWMLWDGTCGFCSATAGWVRRRDKQRQFQICQFQNCPRPPMTDEIAARAQNEMIVITSQGQVIGGARAVLFVLGQTGWGWFARFLAAPPLVWPIDLGYRIIARNRSHISRIFFKGQVCGLDNRYPEVDRKG